MKAVRWMLGVGAVIVIAALIYMLIDGAISLDHSRSQNQVLQAKCELLARLADDGLRGRTTDEMGKIAGVKVIAKIEGAELRLDNVVLRIRNGKVVGIDEEETCR